MKRNKFKKYLRLRTIPNPYENDCRIYYPTDWDENYLLYRFHQEHCIDIIIRSSYLYESTVHHFYEAFPTGTLFCHNWNCETIFDSSDPCVPMTALYYVDAAFQSYAHENYQCYDNYDFLYTYDNIELEGIQNFENQLESTQTYFDEHFEDVDQEDIQFLESNFETTQYSPFSASDEYDIEPENRTCNVPRKSTRHHPRNLTLERFLNKSDSRRARRIKIKCVNKRGSRDLCSIVHSTVRIRETTSTQTSSCHLSEVTLMNQPCHEKVGLNMIEIDEISKNDVKSSKSFSQAVSNGSRNFSSNQLTTPLQQGDMIPSDDPWFQIHTKESKCSQVFSNTVACGFPKIVSKKGAASNEEQNLKMDLPSVHISTEKCIPSNTFDRFTTTWRKVVKGEKCTTTFIDSKTVQKDVESKLEINSPKVKKVRFSKNKKCKFVKLNELSTVMEINVQPELEKTPVLSSSTGTVKKQKPEFICYNTVCQQKQVLIPTETESMCQSYLHAVVGVQKNSIVPDISQPQNTTNLTPLEIKDHLEKTTNCAPKCMVRPKRQENWILKESRRKRSTKSKNTQ